MLNTISCRWYETYVSFPFSSKPHVVASQSHMWLQVVFTMVPHRVIALIVTKMVDLDTSCKYMGWYGHDSL
jgi:hypothetical protein